MMPYRVNDLRWSSSGDIMISKTGDLEDTSVHSLLSFVQEVKTRIRSELYDWKLHPHLGASLADLIGEPNNQQIAEAGKARIQAALTRDGLVAASLIKIMYAPVDQNHIMYRVKITIPDISDGEQLEINLLINTNEFELLFV